MRVVILARGTMDDDYDQDDRIYAVYNVKCNVMYIISLLSLAQKNKVGEQWLA